MAGTLREMAGTHCDMKVGAREIAGTVAEMNGTGNKEGLNECKVAFWLGIAVIRGFEEGFGWAGK